MSLSSLKGYGRVKMRLGAVWVEDPGVGTTLRVGDGRHFDSRGVDGPLGERAEIVHLDASHMGRRASTSRPRHVRIASARPAVIMTSTAI